MAKKTKKEIKLPKTLSKNQATMLVIGLVIGFIAGYIVSMGGAAVGTGEVGDKVITYINETFLNPQGAGAVLDSIESKDGLYLITFNITKDGEVVQAAEAYATMDGKSLIVGQVYDLTENPAMQGTQGTQQASADIPKSDKPNIKMFVMSFCPFGQQAENGLGPAIAELGSTIDWEPHFVIYSNYGGGGPSYCYDDEDKYCSMHGIDELMEGVRQLCIYNDKKDKWWDYVLKINQQCSLNDINECWKEVAKQVGFDTDRIEKCVEDQASSLLAAELALNEEYGVRGSPSVFINDADYSGGRAPGDYLSGICSAFNSQPAGCDANLATSAATASGGCG